MAFTKTTISPDPIVTQLVTCPNVVASIAYDVSAAFFCNFVFRVAGVTAVATGVHGTPTLRVQGTQDASGAAGWTDIMRISFPRDITTGRSSVNAFIIGQTALGGMGAAPSWAAAPYHVCIVDRLTGLNPEWHWGVDLIANTLDLEDGLINAFPNGAIVYTAPWPIRRSAGIANIKSMRFYVDGSRCLSVGDAPQAAIYAVNITAILNVGLT